MVGLAFFLVGQERRPVSDNGEPAGVVTLKDMVFRYAAPREAAAEA